MEIMITRRSAGCILGEGLSFNEALRSMECRFSSGVIQLTQGNLVEIPFLVAILATLCSIELLLRRILTVAIYSLADQKRLLNMAEQSAADRKTAR